MIFVYASICSFSCFSSVGQCTDSKNITNTQEIIQSAMIKMQQCSMFCYIVVVECFVSFLSDFPVLLLRLLCSLARKEVVL